MTPATEAHIEMCRRDPMYFRRSLIIDGPAGPQRWGPLISPVQERDFVAIDMGLKYLCGRGPKPPVQRYWIQRSRGYSKTTDRASDVLYLLFACPRKIDAVVAGEDREQAGLIREQMLKILQFNDWLYEFIDPQAKQIKNKHTDSTLRFLSRDVNSSFGLTPEFVIADEFTHWRQQDFWASLNSSLAKTEHRGGMLIIACNAGVGRGWHYKAKEHAASSPEWYHSSPEGYAPWYNEKSILEQQATLSYTDYRRLWHNEWQDSGGEFVTKTEAEACILDGLQPEKEGRGGWSYVAALDYAEKVDRTVGVVGHLFDGEVIVDRMDVVCPKTIEGSIVPVSWCENWIRNIQRAFRDVTFVVDNYQLIYVIERLSAEGYDIHSFDFKGGVGNFQLALILRGLILQKRVHWYPQCGQILDAGGKPYRLEEDGPDDLVSELSKLVIKSSRSRWRFDHLQNEHDDRAFALGALCRHIVMNSGGIDSWQITPPLDNGMFNLT